MTESGLSILSLAAPLSLAVVALLSRLPTIGTAIHIRHMLRAASAIGISSAFGVLGFCLAAGAGASVEVRGAYPGAAFRVDLLGALLLCVIALLFSVIARFSSTYLRGESRQGVFLGYVAGAGASVEMMVLANHLLVFWLTWMTSSLCLFALLRFHSERPRAIRASRKEFCIARLSDASLAIAFMLLFEELGTGALSQIRHLSINESPPHIAGAGLFLVVAALLKSAQVPVHGWLIEVMESPTPVSALLHAGLLNAGPILVLRFAPVLEASMVGAWLLVLGGGLTALFASVVRQTQVSVKGALGYSSAAHMGFTLFCCGLGAYPAAMLHLVGHSFYKAYAFLSAGSTAEKMQIVSTRSTYGQKELVRPILSVLLACSLYALSEHFVVQVLGPAHGLAAPLGLVLLLSLTHLFYVGLSSTRSIRPPSWLLLRAVSVASLFLGLEMAWHFVETAIVFATPTRPPSLRWVALMVTALWSLPIFVPWIRLENLPWAKRLRTHIRHGLYVDVMLSRVVPGCSPVSRRSTALVGRP